MNSPSTNYHTGSDVAQDKKVPSSSQVGSNLNIGPTVNLLSLNVEGLSMAKCEYLSKLLHDNEVDILFLQETHVAKNSPPSRYTITNYSLVDAIHHEKYGTMVYSKHPQSTSVVESIKTEHNIHRTTVHYCGTTLINIYKPPNENWPSPPLPHITHPTVITGDFNSHHSDWGYSKNNAAGIALSSWASQNNVHLLFDPREKGTFFSARWQKDYSTDLTFLTKDNNETPLHSTRKIMNAFPKSQHRPVLNTIGLTIPITPSLPKPRWNFKKADWDNFRDYIEKHCGRIPPQQDHIQRFTKLILSSAKKHIPRGFRSIYIPCWNDRSKKLLEQYEQTQDTNIAEELLESLQEGRRKRWQDTVEKINFQHSSRQAWNVLKKLNPDKPSNSPKASQVPVDAIAREIKQRSKHAPNYTFEKTIRKEYQRLYQSHAEDGFSSIPVRQQEVELAIKQMKAGKAAGVDGIYPDMIKHLGPRATDWLASSFANIIDTSQFPNTWKEAKILAILKPGKPPNEPSSYRPISLLCCFFKLLERIILTRIQRYINPNIPVEQAGFRPDRNTTEQVLALTSLIETGYERREKTGAVFIDLSAAYDTVWHTGLMYKLAKLIPCKKTLRLIFKMSGKRSYQVILGNDVSKKVTIKNGVPQGSVLAPTLFNVYINDMPTTKSLKLGYADDFALAYRSKSIHEIEQQLSEDTTALHDYFSKWYLKMNTTKTVCTLFHLDNHKANLRPKITTKQSTLPYDPYPKYLGVTLDRTLTYKQHIDNTANKLRKRNGIIKKLAGTSWGANASVLRTSSLALSYSVAEYCSPVWSRSKHTKKIDTLLNETMRTISGTLKSTPTSWLPVMSAIEPPNIRREAATQKQHKQLESLQTNTPLKTVMQTAPTSSRLKSRNPFYKNGDASFDPVKAWKEQWEKTKPCGSDLIEDPTNVPLPGFKNLGRKEWAICNRVRAKQGRTSANLHKWGYKPLPTCTHCDAPVQNMDHLILQCPVTAIADGYNAVHRADDNFITWLRDTQVEV